MPPSGEYMMPVRGTSPPAPSQGPHIGPEQGTSPGPAAWLSITLVFLGCAVVLLSQSFLFYEGSEIFVFPAEYGTGAPMFEKPLRVSGMLLLAPLLVFRRFTDDLRLLSFVYGAPYALLPAMAVFFVLISLRKRPESVSVALIGMCLAPLPWQLFSVSSWSMVNQLSWALLACLVRRHEGQVFRAMVPLLAAFLFLTHALSFLTFFGISVALLVSSRFSPNQSSAEKSIPIARAFVLLGALRLMLVFVEGSESRRFTDLMGVSRNELTDGFHHAGAGFVALYLLLLLASAAVLLMGRPRRRWVSAALQVAAALSLWAYFVVNPRPWLQGVDYHLWTFASMPPLFLVFMVLASTNAGRELPPQNRAATAAVQLLPALAFLIVLASGSYSFRAEMSRLRNAVHESGNVCVEVNDLPREFAEYPVYGFVFSNNYLATAGTRRPSKALLDVTCEHACWNPAPDEHHLFDFGALPRTDASEARCATTMRELIR